MTTAEAKPQVAVGLAGVTVGNTEVCAVTQTQLLYRGYEIADLAANATFEEVAHLLLIGRKPTAGELKAFKDELAEMRPIPEGLKTLLRDIAGVPPAAHPMGILRTGVSYLSHFDPDVEDNAPAAELRKAKRLLAQIPTIIGYGQMVRDGRDPVEPDPGLDHAANLLWCMTGTAPDPLHAKVMDVSLILYAEHDFNASTFSSRVIASTEADMHSAVCGAIGALKGPLHGGANEMAMEMLKAIDASVQAGGSTGTIEQWMDDAFARKRKLMGFGHRVYKQGDHRAGILRSWGLDIAERRGPEWKKWFDIADRVQAIMLEKKNIHPNVDFPCGATYYVMGIPVDQYTPIFVASRITGWCAHIMEQHADNRIIRPLASYAGEGERKWNA
ncbi:MAG: citrate/2-methylcitrate synthase [Planctomycetota bacterium]|jgi:citrate synthase